MLDDMGHEMENAESKMDSTLKKMAKVLRMSNGKIIESDKLIFLPLDCSCQCVLATAVVCVSIEAVPTCPDAIFCGSCTR